MNYAWEGNFLSVSESSITSLLRTPESAGPAMFAATIIGGNGCHLHSPSPQIAAVRQNSSPAHILHSSHVSSLDQCVLISIVVLLHFGQVSKAHTANWGTVSFFSKQRCIFVRKISANIFTFGLFFVANRDAWLKRPSSEQQFDPWLHAFTHVIEIMRDDCFELLVISSWSFCLILASAVSVLVGALGKIHWGYHLHHLRL